MLESNLLFPSAVVESGCLFHSKEIAFASRKHETILCEHYNHRNCANQLGPDYMGNITPSSRDRAFGEIPLLRSNQCKLPGA